MIADTLLRDGHVLLQGFLSSEDCGRVTDATALAHAGRLPTFPLALNDNTGDEGNTIYDSTRSPGLRYCFLRTTDTALLSARVADDLTRATGVAFRGGINTVCLPVFLYGDGASIKAHRGRDVGYGANDYVAVAMLTWPKEDFAGGRLYLNRAADTSSDGKTILWEDPAQRQHFYLEKGDVLVFHNPTHIHGTEPVRPGTRRAFRATTSWRTAVG